MGVTSGGPGGVGELERLRVRLSRGLGLRGLGEGVGVDVALSELKRLVVWPGFAGDFDFDVGVSVLMRFCGRGVGSTVVDVGAPAAQGSLRAMVEIRVDGRLEVAFGVYDGWIYA